jgi:hypothetical protein
MGSFRGVVISKMFFAHNDTLLPRQHFFFSRFMAADSIHVWMYIKGYINQLCGETLTYLHMGVPEPTTNFVGVEVTLTKMQTRRVRLQLTPFVSHDKST